MLVFVLSTLAMAWDTTGNTWPDGQVEVLLDSTVTSVDLDAAEEALIAAAQTWSDAGCGVTVTYGGRVDSAVYGDPDRRNVVFLLETWAQDPGAPSLPIFHVTGTEMIDVDVAFNLQGFAWVTEGADGVNTLDLLSGMTHELGHVVGLWHSTVTDATMSPLLNGREEARTLDDDDVAGLCSLYDGDGTGGQGASCDDAADCDEGLVCLADGAQWYCTTPCGEDADCPDGHVCLDAGADGDVCALDTAPGCGCSGSSAPVTLLALGALGVLATRRRRREGCSS